MHIQKEPFFLASAAAVLIPLLPLRRNLTLIKVSSAARGICGVEIDVIFFCARFLWFLIEI
jgi:hypothetical protein